MKKTIETDGKTYTIHTVNGVDTRTGAVWVKEIREYKPLENGFNLDLANTVYSHIERNEELWNQDAWRAFLGPEEFDEDEAKHIKSMLAFESDLTDPMCGTAMCFAGWVGELSGADWVIDGKAIKEDGFNHAQHNVEQVLITVEQAEWFDEHYEAASEVNRLDVMLDYDVREKLARRGFLPDTHRLVQVSEYALYRLGLVHGDWLGLFAGGNGLSDIRERLDTYARFGPEEDVYVRDLFFESGMAPTVEMVDAYRERVALVDAD